MSLMLLEFAALFTRVAFEQLGLRGEMHEASE